MALRADDVDLARDSRLVARFQEGDADAFDDLYRRYFARLHRYCLKRVGDPHEAEELAQEAFARALRAMPRLDGERRFYPWMTVIAGRLCIDSHRRRNRTEPSAEIDLGGVEDDARFLHQDVDTRQLAQALRQLAPRHREVLELRAVREWSYQEIADHFQVSVGTVESLLHRARKALRRELLAVTGEARAPLAALPAIGWLVRRLQDTRMRLALHAPDAAPALSPVAVKVASVVLAVGAGGMLGGPGLQPATTAPPPVVAVQLTGADRAVLDGSAARTGAPAVEGWSPGGATSRPAPSAADRPPPVAASVGGGAVEVTDAATAAEEAERTEMHGELPLGTVYGVSPNAPVEKGGELVADVQGRVS